PAGLGFAKNLGIPFEDLKVIDTPKGEYLAGDIVVKGKLAAEVLREMIPNLISKLPFKKFMKWGASDFLFGRPIRNLLFLFDGEIIPMTLANISSDRNTFGHRFLGSRIIPVASRAEYRQKLKDN